MADQIVGSIAAQVGLVSTLDRDLAFVNAALERTETRVRGFGEAVSSELGYSVNNAGSSISRLTTTISTGLGNAFSGAGTAITGFGNSVSVGIGNALGRVGRELSTWGLQFTSNLGNALQNSGDAVVRWGSSTATAFGGAFNSIGNGIRGFGNTISTGLNSAFNSARNAIGNFVNSADAQFKRLIEAGNRAWGEMQYIGVMIAAVFSAKMFEGMQEATQVFMTFDDQMRKVQAVTDTTGQTFDALTTQARFLGATTSYTAQQAAEGMTQLAQAGFSADQVMASMPATLNLARSSMTDLGTAAQIMAAIMNGFQIGADQTGRAADVLTKAANATATDVTLLGEAMKYTSSLANQMGWSLEETTAAVGLLSNAGIRGTMAGTVLRNSITRLIAPTQNAEAILNSYGITMDMVNPKTHSLAEIIDVLGAHAVSTGDLMEVFGMRAGPGMLALIQQGSGAIRGLTTDLENSAGYAQRAADMMDAGWGGTMRRLGDTVEALRITFGSAIAGIATPFIQALTSLGYAISQLPTPIIYAITAITMLATAATGLAVGLALVPKIVGMAEAALTGLAFILTTAASAAPALIEGLGLMELTLASAAGSIGAVVVAGGEIIVVLGLIAAAAYILEERFGLISNSWQVMQDIFTIGANAISTAINLLLDQFYAFVDGVTDALDETWLGSLLSGVGDVFSGLSSLLGDAKDNIHQTAEDIRAEDEMTALSAQNVQASIQKAQQDTTSSYQYTAGAVSQSTAAMLTDGENWAGGTVGANDSVISSNNDVISSFNGVKEAGTGRVGLEYESNVDIISGRESGGTGGGSGRGSTGANAEMADVAQEIELANGNTLKIDKSGRMVIETFDGMSKSLEDIAQAQEVNTQITQRFGTSMSEVSAGIQLADGNMLTLNNSGQLVIRTSDGIEKSISSIESSMSKSTGQTKQYAASVEMVRDGIKLADGNMLGLNASGNIVIRTSEGVEKSITSVGTAIQRNADGSKDFAKSYDMIRGGIQLADGNILKLNEDGQAVIVTADGISKTFNSVSNAVDKSTENTDEYAKSMAMLEQGVTLASGSIIQLNQNGEVVITTADGITRTYADLARAVQNNAEVASVFGGAFTEVQAGVTLADGSILTLDKDGQSVITTVDGVKTSFDEMGKSASGAASGFTGEAYKPTLADIQKGIELADGSMLTFNKSGELVLETIDGIQKKVSEMGPNISFETKAGKTIDIINDGGSTKKMGYQGPSTAKTVSLKEAHDNYIKETTYPDTPQGDAQRWADRTGHAVLFNGKPVNGYLTESEQAKLDAGQWKGEFKTPTTTRTKTLADSEAAQKAADLAPMEKRKRQLETTLGEYNPLTGKRRLEGDSTPKEPGPWTQFFGTMAQAPGQLWNEAKTAKTDAGNFLSGGKNWITDTISGIKDYNSEAAVASDQTDTWGQRAKSLLKGDWRGFINGTETTADATKTATTETENLDNATEKVGRKTNPFSNIITSITGIGVAGASTTDQTDAMGNSIESQNYISLSGLYNQIFGTGEAETEAGGKATEHQGILETLGNTDMGQTIASVLGIGTGQDTSAGRGTAHQGILDTIASTDMGATITSILGIGGGQDDSAGRGTTHQGILDTMKGTSMSDIINQILGVGNEQDNSATKAGDHQTVLDTLKGTTFGELITSIFGIGDESDKSKTKSDGLLTTLGNVAGVAFSSLLTELGNLETALGEVAKAASTMWENVKEYVDKAKNYMSGSGGGGQVTNASNSPSNPSYRASGNNTANTVNNLKINTINNNGTSVSSNAMKLFTYGGA